MKKLLLVTLLGVLALLPFQAKAETLFGFMDGKYYDESQTLKYMCFLDNNCYDLNGQFGFKREVPAGVPITPIAQDPISFTPIPFVPTPLPETRQNYFSNHFISCSASSNTFGCLFPRTADNVGLTATLETLDPITGIRHSNVDTYTQGLVRGYMYVEVSGLISNTQYTYDVIVSSDRYTGQRSSASNILPLTFTTSN